MQAGEELVDAAVDLSEVEAFDGRARIGDEGERPVGFACGEQLNFVTAG